MPLSARCARVPLGVVLLALLLLCACTRSTQPSPSVEPSRSVSPSAAAILPPGCEPIDLRSPTGERLDLTGTWFEDAEGAPMTWRIKTQGDCVWGVGIVEDIPFDEAFDAANIQTLRGHLGTDFVIEGEIVLMGQDVNFLRAPIYSPVRFLIEIDDSGQLSLREDRVHGEPGPRCVEPTYQCLRPLVLLPQGEGGD